MAMIGHIIHILLRLPFGAAPAPSEVCVSSEMTIDLAIDILNSEWDPTTTPTPNRNLILPPKWLPKPSHYPTALPLDVDIPYRPYGSTDGYIDDIWTIAVDNGNYLAKAKEAIYMTIHLTFCPFLPNEPIPRNDPLSLNKLKAEAQSEEIKILLR